MANTKIPSELIADSSITAAKLADGTITTADIADSNVTTAKIANSGVTTAKIGDAQVTTAKITDSNVTTGKIADDAVTTAKMASNSVTSDTIASGITLAGLLTVDGGIDVDNFHLDGTTLALSSGNMTLDSAGDITLDAGGSSIHLHTGGTDYGQIHLASNNIDFHSEISNGNIRFFGKDGSSDVTALTLNMAAAGAATFNSSVFVGNHLYLVDNKKAVFGAGEDLQISHVSSGSYNLIQSYTSGELVIESNGNTKIRTNNNDDMAKFLKNGAVELYYDNAKKLETTTNGINVTGTIQADNLTMLDNEFIRLGNSNDLQIYHDGSNSYINDVGTGSLYIKATNLTLADAAGEQFLNAYSNGGVLLYHNNVEKLATNSGGVTVTGTAILGGASFVDNATAYFGTGLDLRLWHDGSNSYIRDTNSGSDLLIQSNNIVLEQVDGTNMIHCAAGAVQLYHSGSTKLATTATGVTVTGGVSVGGATPFLMVQDSDTSNSGVIEQAGTDLFYGNSSSSGTHIFKNNSSNGGRPSVNGTELMRIGSDGAITHSMTGQNTTSINTTNSDGPITLFKNNGTTRGMIGNAEGLMNGGTSNFGIRATADLIISTGGGTERMRIESDGDVIIGTSGTVRRDLSSGTSPTLSLEGSFPAINLRDTSGHGAFYGINGDTVYLGGHNNTAVLGFFVNGGDRMNIRANGDVNIGITGDQSAKLFINNANATTPNLVIKATHANAYGAVKFVNSNGEAGSISLNPTAVAYNTSSDYRLKENVGYTWDATTRLKQLKPARFNFIADATNTLVDGFIAHEAATVVPESVTGTHNAVDGNGDPVMQGIDQSKLVPLLVKTIQELEARITALEG